MIADHPIPDLSPEDRATLLALIDPVNRGASAAADPARGTPNPSPTDDSTVPDLDPLTAANFLARPDIQPHLEALRALFAFRQEIERQHRTDRLVDALLEIAKTSPDLTQRRLAATTALRALYPPSNRARSASEGPAPHRPTNPTPHRGGGSAETDHAQREPWGGASAPGTPQPSGAGHSGPPPSLPTLLPPHPTAHPTTNNTPSPPNHPSSTSETPERPSHRPQPAAPTETGGRPPRRIQPAAPTVDPSADTPAANHQYIHTLSLQPTYGPVLLTLTDNHPLHTHAPPPHDTS